MKLKLGFNLHTFLLLVLLVLFAKVVEQYKSDRVLESYTGSAIYEQLSDTCKAYFGDDICDDSVTDCGQHYKSGISLDICDECQTTDLSGALGFEKCGQETTGSVKEKYKEKYIIEEYEAEEEIPGDFNGDGCIDIVKNKDGTFGGKDGSQFYEYFQSGSLKGDINGDGKIDFSDFVEFAALADKYQCPKTADPVMENGDYWLVENAPNTLDISDKLNPSQIETLRDVEKVIGPNELDALSSGKITNAKGSASYSQFLEILGEDSKLKKDTGYVAYLEDHNDIYADFLFFKADSEIGTYNLVFTPPIISRMDESEYLPQVTPKMSRLEDFLDMNINLFGKKYTIVGAATSTEIGFLQLLLMNEPIKVNLLEGKKGTYSFAGKNYEVKLQSISPSQVQFVVNGETTIKRGAGQHFLLNDSTFLVVDNIVYQNYINGIHSVSFYLGKELIRLKDINIYDSLSSTNLQVNDESINEASVLIKGSKKNDEVSINEFIVIMKADNDYYVPAGSSLSAKIKQEGDEPEVLFTQNWDIVYNGLINGQPKVYYVAGVSKQYSPVDIKPVEQCTDSDAQDNTNVNFGDSHYVKGTLYKNGQPIAVDSCNSAPVLCNNMKEGCKGDYVIEWYFASPIEACDQQWAAFKCPNGCFDGACKPINYTKPLNDTIAGDFDGNGCVEFADFTMFSEAFGSKKPYYDLNGNGEVDFADFTIFSSNFGKCTKEAKDKMNNEMNKIILGKSKGGYIEPKPVPAPQPLPATPTIKPVIPSKQLPPGSCQNSCNAQSKTGSCFCDSVSVTQYGDYCSDIAAYCPDVWNNPGNKYK